MQKLNELLENISLQLKFDEVVILTSLLENQDKVKNVHNYSFEKSVRYESEKYNLLRQSITNISSSILIVSEKAYIPIINRILWECPNVNGYVCIDTDNP